MYPFKVNLKGNANMPNEYKDYFSFENPGTFRISIKEAFDGGTSDPRNASLLKMFSMIDIGEGRVVESLMFFQFGIKN